MTDMRNPVFVVGKTFITDIVVVTDNLQRYNENTNKLVLRKEKKGPSICT